MSLPSHHWRTQIFPTFSVWPLLRVRLHGGPLGLTIISDAAFGFTFVSCTAMILAGAMLERGRLLPSMLFLLCWTTFVYYL